jgi:PAS domain S-box-containing protein
MNEQNDSLVERMLQTHRPNAPTPLMEELLDAAGMSLWDQDLISGQMLLDRTGFEQLGLSATAPQMPIKDWLKRIHPDDRQRVQADTAALATGKIDTYELEYRIQHSDGRWLWLRSHGRGVKHDAEGKTLRACGFHQDITALKSNTTAIAEPRPQQIDVNRIHSSIREIDRLITGEHNHETILQQACEILVHKQGLHHCMILWNEEYPKLFQAGLAESDFEAMNSRLGNGSVPACMAQALESSEISIVENPGSTCLDCPFSDKYDKQSGLALQLASKGRVYGALAIAAPDGKMQTRDEQEQLQDLADHLAYALHKLEIERQQERLNSIVNTVHNPIIMISTEGRYLSVNEAYSSLFSMPSQHLIGKSVADFIGQERYQNEVEPYLEKAMQGETVRYEVRADFPKKGLRWMQMECFPFRSDKGTITAVTVQGIDITDRKEQHDRLEQTNRELRDSRLAALNMMEDAILTQKKMKFEQALFRTFMDTLPAAVFFKDSAGRFISVNKAMAKIFGTVPDKMIGQTDADLFPEDQAQRKRKDELAVMQSRQLLECEEAALDRYYYTTKAPRINEASEVVGIYGVSWDITDRIEAEKQLKLSQFAMDHSSLAIFLADQSGRFHYVNQAACRQLDYSSEELQDMTVIDIEARHVSSDEEWHDSWKRIKENGHQHFEGAHRTKSGRTFPVDVVANFITWADEEYIIGFTQDVTEKNETERQLLLTQFAIDHSSAQILMIRPDHTFEYVNHAACRMLGYTREELLTLKITDIACNWSPENADDVWLQVKKNRTFSVEDCHIKKDGSTFPVEIQLHHVEHHGQEYIFAYSQDISERVAAREQLRQSEERFRGMLEELPYLSVMGFGLDGRIRFWNQGSELTYGYTSEEAIGAKMVDLIIPEQEKSFIGKSVIDTERTGCLPPASAYNFLRKDGSVVPVLTCHATNNKKGSEFEMFCLDVDISALKEAQDALKKLNNLQSLILNNSSLGIALIRNRTIEWTNPALCEIFQRKDAEWCGQSARLLYADDETYELIGQQVYREIFAGKKVDRNIQFKRSDGTLFWCHLIGRAMEQDNPETASVWMFEDITQRMQAEQKIADLARFPEENINPVIRISRTGILLYANRSATDLLSESDQEIGKPVSKTWSALMQKAIGTGQVYETELAYEGRVFSVTLAPMLERDYVNIYARDITDREEALKKQKASEQLLRSIIDTLPSRVWWKDCNFRLLGSNILHAQDMNIEDPSLLIGKRSYDLFDQERAERYEADDREVMESGHPKLGMQYHIVDPDNGKERWMESNRVPLRDSDGNMIGTVGTETDITERKKAELELQRFHTAIEQSPESIVITDTTGTIQYVNPTFERVTGYTREEVLGENPRLLKSGKNDALHYAKLWKTIAAGKVWEGRLINKCKDGTLFTEEASIAPIKDQNGQIINYVAIKRDITMELVREEEFRQSQKMEAVGLLAGGVAHDFNNILQAILGFSELLIYDLEENSLCYKNVVEIKHSATRAVGLTRQLLTFGRKTPVDMHQMDINDAIYDTEALISILLGEQYQLELELDKELPKIDADSGQLTQIIMNLAVNARDAMPEGGRLTITTEQVTLEKRDAIMPDSRPGAFVCLSLTDTGCGIDEHLIPRLFEPFFTTKDIGKGTGLGLSVVYGIVKQGRGWINVYSEKGHGTTFKLFFPTTDHPDEVASDRKLIDSGTLEVLVVDDDPQTRSLMIEILNATQFKTLAAGSLTEAVDLFEQHGGRFNFLLADMMLPDGSGLDLADRLRSTNPDLPVLLCSGYRDQSKRWESLKDSNYHFINKPFTAVGLVRSIQETIIETTTEK